MERMLGEYTAKEALLFNQKVMYLSKALWRSIEKDWEQWIKPYNLTINEHHILLTAYQLKGASISEIAKFAVMHISTAFNFSRKLEKQGYLRFSKKENDRRNTYIQLTEKGEELLLEIFQDYAPIQNTVFNGALPLKKVYGRFPDMIELMSVVRHIYGHDFMDIFERTLKNIENEFVDEHGTLQRRKADSDEVGYSALMK
ncbi:HTH-type transcriptional regulator Hpr [Priestia abyssalis]|uniref:HTH-type transcriptional regulator Hpr n=1 Tax=Priestia abyssalis TaxID=1221450 RepID=UPI000994DB10|nr:HTH-type transcriptional regulator Hpr [Priestia abyssalis]